MNDVGFMETNDDSFDVPVRYAYLIYMYKYSMIY